MTRARVCILISGGGSNMYALVKASRAANYPAEIVCVVSNRPDAGGLKIAANEGVATHVVNHRDYASREAFDAALNAYMQTQNLDLIACAGFMRIMSPVLIAPWQGRMINIHPSLLPLYKGLHTHQRAIADSQKFGGCSVHYVTLELDGGPVIAQTQVPILEGDTAESLAARVLQEEHKLYPAALAKVAQSFGAWR
jgi:phosphoribosylglycinamide formyltransferase 1